MPVLIFDFDNTITLGDVLDLVIERYSLTEAWREIESAWQAGRISTQECLRRQISDLRVSESELMDFVAGVAIDPEFAKIVAWAASNEVEVIIASDNAALVVREILRRRGLPELPIYANEIIFAGNRPEIHFPYHDVTCSRCAHCKAQHVRARTIRPRIFIGDGLSDICPALAADVVFAKDSLATYLAHRELQYRRMNSLADVSRFLHATYERRAPGRSLATETLAPKANKFPGETEVG